MNPSNIWRPLPITALMSLLAAACGSSQTPQASYPIHVAELKGTAPDIDGCEVVMQLEHRNGDDVIYAYDDADTPKNIKQSGVCIKRAGQPLRIPDKIRLASPNLPAFLLGGSFFLTRTNWSPICREDSLRQLDQPSSCEWNGAYRAKFPLDIRILATKGRKLRDFVKLVRVYENGSAVYRWNDSSYDTEIAILHKSILDHSLPFDAELDLQVLPATATVDPAQLTAELAPAREAWMSQVRRAATESLKQIVESDPALSAAADCLAWQVRKVQYDVDQLIESVRVTSPGARPEKCDDVALPPIAKESWLSEYQQAKKSGEVQLQATRERTRQAIEREVQQIAAKLDISKGQAEEALKSLKESGAAALKARIAQAGNTEEGKKLKAALQRLPTQVAQAEERLTQLIGTADDVKTALGMLGTTVDRAVDRANRLAKSSADQAEQVSSLVARLEAAGGPFADRKANPDPLPESQVVRMRYREHFQRFMFAPWHGIPIRVTGPNVGTELSAGNAVPGLDLFGMRWQWGRSRFQEARFGLGGFYYPDKAPTTDPTTGATTGTTNVYHFAFDANGSIGTLHLGFGYAVGDSSAFQERKDRIRLIVGLDLYKLIVGENIEAMNP
jgi:hypothetical protein